jgi:hypothetical protein
LCGKSDVHEWVVRDMPTGIMLGMRANTANVVDDVVSQARRAHEIGVRQVWLAQRFDYEAITLAALVGRPCPRWGWAPRWCRSIHGIR